jgi:hypothetical protein
MRFPDPWRRAGYPAKALFLLTVLCFFAAPALAAEAQLPIRATIIYCGPPEERPMTCQKDQRCCNLREKADPDPGKEDVGPQRPPAGGDFE